RSILAPLYLVGTLVLSVTARLGLTTFLTVTVGGDAGIGKRVAVYVLVFLVALGVDYTIFLLSRYRQELVSTPPATALRTSLVRTGGVISSAGLILAGTFAVLTTQPIRELHQFGLAMAIGILLDTFVVRPLVVPAIVRMLGDRALWPSRPPHPQHDTTDADDVPAKEAGHVHIDEDLSRYSDLALGSGVVVLLLAFLLFAFSYASVRTRAVVAKDRAADKALVGGGEPEAETSTVLDGQAVDED